METVPDLPVMNSFWDRRYWLPSGVTWEDPHVPGTRDIVVAFPIAVFLLVLRHFLERYAFEPIAVSMGVSDDEPPTGKANGTLHRPRHKNKAHPVEQVASCRSMIYQTASKAGPRSTRAANAPSKITKFKETSFRFFIYTILFLYGLWALWDKHWFWEFRDCFYNIPFHPLTEDIRWYYLIELGLYFSLMASQFSDVRRKDFAVNLIHHLATIVLVTFSWIIGGIRIGAITLLLHDASDGILELAKLCHYLKLKWLTSRLFIVFTSVWMVTRVYIYPMHIVLPMQMALVDEWEERWRGNLSCPFMMLLLWSLFFLHVYWTYCIFKVIIRRLGGKSLKDVRSDTEESEDEAKKHG